MTDMSSITLPGPQHTFHLRPTLELVTTMEDIGGNIFKLADQLIAQELGLNDILRLLTAAYQACDRSVDAHDIADYLLNDCAVPPSCLLGDILLAILSPVQAMGAVAEDDNAGKPQAAAS